MGSHRDSNLRQTRDDDDGRKVVVRLQLQVVDRGGRGPSVRSYKRVRAGRCAQGSRRRHRYKCSQQKTANNKTGINVSELQEIRCKLYVVNKHAIKNSANKTRARQLKDTM